MGLDIYSTIGFGWIVYDPENEENTEPLLSIAEELEDLGPELSCEYIHYVDSVLEVIAYNDDFEYCTYGVDDYTYYAICLKESIISSNWLEKLQVVELNKLREKVGWRQRIKEFQRKNGLDEVEPGWLFGSRVSY